MAPFVEEANGWRDKRMVCNELNPTMGSRTCVLMGVDWTGRVLGRVFPVSPLLRLYRTPQKRFGIKCHLTTFAILPTTSAHWTTSVNWLSRHPDKRKPLCLFPQAQAQWSSLQMHALIQIQSSRITGRNGGCYGPATFHQAFSFVETAFI